MERTSQEQLAAIKMYIKQTGSFENKSVMQIREEMRQAASKMPAPADTVIREATIGQGQLCGEWVIPNRLEQGNENRAIVYFHGGGFVAGTCAFYRDLCARIARASGIRVLIIDYRLAPEYPFPAANDDCLHAYRSLLADGFSAQHLVVGGDSVGGSLALMTLLSLRDNGESLPAGAFLISPHTDLVHLDGESYTSRAALDPTGSREGNRQILRAYLGGRPETPLLSPLRMNLEKLPDLLIQAGDHEVLLSDAVRLADRARAAGVQVELEIWDQMWCAFQLMAFMLPEARQAIANIGRFVQARLR